MTTKNSDPYDLAIAGFDMNAKEAVRLELILKSKPNDLDTRTKLLGYYMYRPIADANAPRRRQAHCLWVIRNHPDATIAGLPFCHIDRLIDTTAYGKMKALWDRQTVRYRDDIPVLSNAARFYAADERHKAITLLKRLQRLEDRNPDWKELLGDVYYRQSLGVHGLKRKEAAARALNQWETALPLLRTDEERFYLLTRLAPVAVDAAKYSKAVRYSNELLKWARKFRANWNHGNAIHNAHIGLGRVALRKRRFQDAKMHLIASARTTGSPQLNTFGPSQELAAELLAHGEVKTVMRYLNLCRKFWRMGGKQIDAWTTNIRNSGTTDFFPVFDTEEMDRTEN